MPNSAETPSQVVRMPAMAAQWEVAIAVSELSEFGLHARSVAGHKVILMRTDSGVVAYRDACPHEGYPLSVHGERQDFVLVCNKHLWEFDAASGEHISRIPRPQCNLLRYPTREASGQLEIDVSAVPPA
jgi:nitrite reductase/ring-hydroxylating ferredoxin subunit